MKTIKENFKGILLCLAISSIAWIAGNKFPIIGGPIIAILIGMVMNLVIKDKANFDKGIKFCSKKVLQYAVVLLGFGMNLSIVFSTGKQSLPIIICTISIALISAYILYKILKSPKNISILIGIGSSICGGSAIAATAPVIDADDEEIAASISVIFLFNVLAALIFPSLANLLGFSKVFPDAFGIFAGTAINDTSSVTAAASTWDSLYNLGSATLDKAVTVKLTRTLAIIPITFGLALLQGRNNKDNNKIYDIRKAFPTFILYFILASIITTLFINFGIDSSFFKPAKSLSKLFIIIAMSAIGLGTDINKLIKTGIKPILIGAVCWINITIVCLILQKVLLLW